MLVEICPSLLYLANGSRLAAAGFAPLAGPIATRFGRGRGREECHPMGSRPPRWTGWAAIHPSSGHCVHELSVLGRVPRQDGVPPVLVCRGSPAIFRYNRHL